MAPRQISDARRELGTRLREIRAAAGMRYGTDMSRRLEMAQTKISKLERGEQLPNLKELDQWLTACDANTRTRTELREMLGRAWLRGTTWNEEYQGGDPTVIAAHPAESGMLELADQVIQGFTVSIFPRWVQTEDYAREQLAGCNDLAMSLDAKAIEAIVAQRMKRQSVLREPGRDVCLIVGEGALHTRFGSRETMIEQLGRVMELMELPALDLRILSFDAPCPVVPLTGFRLVGDTVVIGMFHGEVTLAKPADVVAYTAAFEALCTASVSGDGAKNMIRRAMEEL